MRKLTHLIMALALLCGLAAAAAAPASACDPDTAGMAALFATLEAALRAGDEAAFKAGWHPDGYTENLVGGSGVSGERVFKQGSHKQWYLKPNMSMLKSPGRCGPWIVPADIWSWRDERAVDHVDVSLIWHDGAWLILGAGEEPAEVEALARRLEAGQPLPPPPKEPPTE
jgi:hypothetical protein